MDQLTLTEGDILEISKTVYPESDVVLEEYAVAKSEKHGYLSDILTLEMVLRVGGILRKNSFFVKTYTVPTGQQTDFVGETGMFEKEVRLYKEVFAEFGKWAKRQEWCPRYYFSKHRVLVLQDLVGEDFRMKTDGYLLDEDHLSVVLSAVADLHASGIAFEVKTGRTIVQIHPGCFKEFLYDETVADSPSKMWKARQIADLQAAIEFLDEYTSAEKECAKARCPRVINEIYRLSKRSERWRNVLVHGDLWNNNILFRYENGKPVECRLVDFQFSRYAPPMHDVMHLLHLTTEKEFRDKRERHFLQIYRERLTQSLAAEGLDADLLYPEIEFEESIEEYRMAAVIQSCLSMHYLLGGRKVQEDPRFHNWHKDELNRYLKNTRRKHVKQYFDDPVYANRMRGILRELIDRYVLPNYW